jgi:nucleolar protein TMA23
MDDSSASATEASIPASGASTPPTSASETEAPAKAVKKSDKKSKRRRQDNDVVATVKKAEKAEAKGDKGQERSSTKDQKTVARKLAKLSPKKRALYKERAAAKKQTINEYILRRISKKSAKRANRYAEAAPQNLFFTDVSGDTTLPYHQTTVTPSRPILGLAQESLEDAAPGVTSLGKPDFAAKKKPTEKPTKKLQPSAEYRAKKAGGGKNADREKRKLKKAD